MSTHPRLLATVSLLLALLASAYAYAGYRSGETLQLRQALAEDLYAAGRVIESLTAIDGDLVAAAQRLRIDAPVAGDLLAAAERVELAAAIGDDARLAGRELTLRAPIGGHLVAAGAEVTLTEEASVADWAWLAGGSVRIDGRVGSLKAAAQSVTLGGSVAGDAQISGERIELLSQARIGGDLLVRSRTPPIIADTARIGGRMILIEPPGQAERPAAPGLLGAAVSLLVLLVTAGAIYLLFPGYAHAAGTEARAAPLKAAALGLALLTATPVLVVLLFVTGVGFLLGLTLLALYLVGLLLAVVTGLFCAAHWRLRPGPTHPARGKGLLALALAVIALGVLQLVPILGGLVIFLLLLIGFGALGLRLWRLYRGAPAPA